MSKGLEIRDPIHGFIYREACERDIIDTPVYQRLRRIKQLAMASIVYPGAVHTRFEHSLGALHVAGKMADRLLADDSEKRIVRFTALLHDIGHGPLSHVSEDALAHFNSKEKLGLGPKDQIHESFSRRIILTDQHLQRLISDKEREQIVGLLDGSWGHSILRSIMSGPLDADKQDYLLRDSYFCGVKYGVYDLDRLGDAFSVYDDGEDRVLALSEEGVHTVEQFVLAKYYMTTQVYRHRIRLITDAMIVRGITLGIEVDEIPFLRDLYCCDGSADYLKNYLGWYDERLMSEILRADTKEGYAKQLFRRLQNRDLLKLVAKFRPEDIGDAEIRKALFDAPKSFFRLFEREVAAKYRLDSGLVIAQRVRMKSVRDQVSGTEGQIIVLRAGRQNPSTFENESTLFRSINEKLDEQHIEVYAPVQYNDERDKRKRRNQFHTEIREIAEQLAKAELTKAEAAKEA